MSRIILVTDTSLRAALVAAYTLSAAGHTVYAGIPDARGRNAELVTELVYHAREHAVDLYPVELDASSSASLREVRALIIATHGHLDGIVRTAPHWSRFGSSAQAPVGAVVLRTARSKRFVHREGPRHVTRHAS